MYKRILLASDGTKESLVALREGALIGRGFGAEAHLLIIDREDIGQRMADGIYTLPRDKGDATHLLEFGLDRLRRLGVPATGEAVSGDPIQVIEDCVRRVPVDLIVVGHRRQTFLERWWSGAAGVYLVDGVPCSVLIARDMVTDQDFEAYLSAASS